jgi:hypothetical protein
MMPRYYICLGENIARVRILFRSDAKTRLLNDGSNVKLAHLRSAATAVALLARWDVSA